MATVSTPTIETMADLLEQLHIPPERILLRPPPGEATEEVKVPFDLGGKKTPCPNCRKIVKVPMPLDSKPKDWRTTQNTGPSAAASNLPEKLSDAWGTEQKGRVSREAMEEAGALPQVKAKPLGVGGWIKRGLWICLIGGIGIFVFSWAMRARDANREKNAMDAAKNYLPKMDPLHQAGYFLASGEIEVRNMRANEAQNNFQTARSILLNAPKDKDNPLEFDLLLMKVVLALAEMGGSGDVTLKRDRAQLRFDWADGIVQNDMLQTLQAMRSEEAKAAALRALACKFIAQGKPEIAQGLAINLANQGMRSPTGAILKAIQLATLPPSNIEESKEKDDPNQIRPPDLSNELTDSVARVAYTQGHALKGEYAKAFEIAAFKGPSTGRMEACVAGADIALADAKNNEAAKFITEGLNAYKQTLKEQKDIKEKSADWTILELIRLGSRTSSGDGLKELVETLSPSTKPRAQLDIFQGRLERNPTQPADGVEGHVRKAGVTGAGEEVDAVLPHGSMDVHAAAVVQKEGLGHEGGRLAMLLGDVLDNVFVLEDTVGHIDQWREAHVDFTLAGGGDLVVLGLDFQAAADHGQHHFRANIV